MCYREINVTTKNTIKLQKEIKYVNFVLAMKTLLKLLFTCTPFWLTIPAITILLLLIVVASMWSVAILCKLSFTTLTGWAICSVLMTIIVFLMYRDQNKTGFIHVHSSEDGRIGMFDFILAFFSGPITFWLMCIFGIILWIKLHYLVKQTTA